MDTDELQTSRPSTSYFTSHSTVSVTSWRSERDPTLVADRRKLFERESSHSTCNASTIPGTLSRRLPRSKSFRTNSPSLQQSVSASVPHPRTSVADLRKSFENAKPSLQSKPSHRSIQQSQDMSPPTKSKLRLELLAEKRSDSPNGASHLNPPLIGKGQIIHVRPRTKAVELATPLYPGGSSVQYGSSPSLPRSRRFDLGEACREGDKASPTTTELESSSQPANIEAFKGWENNVSLETSMDGLGIGALSEKLSNGVLMKIPMIQNEDSAAGGPRDRAAPGTPKTSKTLSPGSRQPQDGGKVSQLRRFFKSSSKRLASPLSFMDFRPRPSPGKSTCDLTEEYLSSPWNKSESSESTHTVARKHSMVPSLTTEISVNDFFCDFASSPNSDETATIASPSNAAVEEEPHSKHESPVRRRIQQFERLSRDSLRGMAIADSHNEANGDGLLSISENGNKRSSRHEIVDGWRPIHRKGAAIWRKLSNSFGRSLDIRKNCNSGHDDHEPINTTDDTSLVNSLHSSPSLTNNSRQCLHHPSSFGYSLFRTSHVSHHFISSSHTMSNIPLSVGDSSNSHPKGKLNDSYAASPPDTPIRPLAVRKSFPIVTRISSGLLRHSGFGFGLDGNYTSKHAREEKPRSSKAAPSGASTPPGGRNALLSAMSKQSAAERSRRREEEKNSHRYGKSRTLSRWREKGKARAALHSAGACKAHDKGKGKGKGKETAATQAARKEEGQASRGQEDEANKKTASGFVVFESKNVKLRHPRPRRPGQVRKLTNMYKDKGSSGGSVNTKMSSGTTLKESRQGFRQKASSALGLGSRKGYSHS
ncbi:hypothetical protein F4802DRAFT_608848 [Xylaria palmicola]|nr:hypothetical protein F4802DRAFT_608848 [Xylaria palmicola]